MDRFYDIWDNVLEFMSYLIEFLFKTLFVALVLAIYVAALLGAVMLILGLGGAMGLWTGPF